MLMAGRTSRSHPLKIYVKTVVDSLYFFQTCVSMKRISPFENVCKNCYILPYYTCVIIKTISPAEKIISPAEQICIKLLSIPFTLSHLCQQKKQYHPQEIYVKENCNILPCQTYVSIKTISPAEKICINCHLFPLLCHTYGRPNFTKSPAKNI